MATRSRKQVEDGSPARASGAPAGPRAPGDPMPPGGVPLQIPPRERVPSNVPLVYADQVSDVLYGVHTSKVIFGLETAANVYRPQVVVTIPTASLLAAALSIVRDLSKEAVINETLERVGSMVSLMRGGAEDAKGKPAATKRRAS
jgi:hypothetical protein